MSAIILGILANALYDLIKGELKGERTLTDIARQIDEHVLSKSKLFNRQTVAKILQEERHAALLKAWEGHQQKQGESTLIRLGDEFGKILLLPENRILQECVDQILISFQEDDHKRNSHMTNRSPYIPGETTKIAPGHTTVEAHWSSRSSTTVTHRYANGSRAVGNDIRVGSLW